MKVAEPWEAETQRGAALARERTFTRGGLSVPAGFDDERLRALKPTTNPAVVAAGSRRL